MQDEVKHPDRAKCADLIMLMLLIYVVAVIVVFFSIYSKIMI